MVVLTCHQIIIIPLLAITDGPHVPLQTNLFLDTYTPVVSKYKGPHHPPPFLKYVQTKLEKNIER